MGRKKEKAIIDLEFLEVAVALGLTGDALLKMLRTKKKEHKDNAAYNSIIDRLFVVKDYSVYKKNGGNHNPSGKNQYSKQENNGIMVDKNGNIFLAENASEKQEKKFVDLYMASRFGNKSKTISGQ